MGALLAGGWHCSELTCAACCSPVSSPARKSGLRGRVECRTMITAPEADGPARPGLTGLWAWLLGGRAAVL